MKSGAMTPTENPYHSPATDPRPEAQVFPPRIMVRDAIDVIVQLFAGIPVVAALGGVGLFGYLLSVHCGITLFGALATPILVTAILIVMPMLIVTAILMVFGIRNLSMEESGIRLWRKLGGPRFVEWREVRDIRRVTRIEVFRDWSIRNCNRSCSLRDHFRIEWTGGYFLYPPRDIDSFVRAFQTHLDPSVVVQPDPVVL